MASNRVAIPATWGLTPTISVTTEAAAVMIRNTSTSHLYFWVTEDDTVPPVNEDMGFVVEPTWSDQSQFGLTLYPGERLWCAIPNGAEEVSILNGQA